MQKVIKPKTKARAPIGAKHFIALMQAGEPEWSLFAVRAPAKSVAKALAAFRKPWRWVRNAELKPKKPMEPVAPLIAIVEVLGNPWTLVFRSLYRLSADEIIGVPQEAKALSIQLETKVITFFSEDTSNATSYQILFCGRLIETAEWLEGGEFTKFHSSERLPTKLKTVDVSFADQVFREYGVYIPACYPHSRGESCWLAVDKRSLASVKRADLMEFRPLAGRKALHKFLAREGFEDHSTWQPTRDWPKHSRPGS
jgi:hypothetical protein